MYQHASAMHQQVHSINSSAVELSANLVRRAMLHRAEGESYAPAGAFNQKHSIDQQVDSIGDNSRREFLQQEIDASRRRDMLQQEHLKCQQARAIDQVVNSIVSNAHDSSTAMLSIE